MDKSYFLRFPSVLRTALETYNLEFPVEIQWEYKPQVAFRGITRKDGEDIEVQNSDFLSYAELGKKPRGLKSDNDDIGLYSCSCYKNKKQLEVSFNLPRPNRRIIRGQLYDNKGCIYIDPTTGHIDWWIYENADPAEDFEVIDDEKC